MRRISMVLVSLIVSGACLVGSSAGQDDSVFRFAETEGNDASLSDVKGQEEESKEESSYDSYDSWPRDGKSLVQQKAIFRAQQRELRVAARKWYGYTASRPPVYGNPYFTDVYSPSLWSLSVYNRQSLYGPFGWYFPRRSVSAANTWSPLAYATIVK